jgi:hypothetical protein
MKCGQLVVWLLLAIMVFSLVGLLIYADHFGAVKITETVLRVFEVSFGAVIGAAANTLTK